MVTKEIKCDRCGTPIQGRGYSVTWGKKRGVSGMEFFVGINEFWSHHYCGRQCLMLEINDRVDQAESAEVGA